MNNKRPRYLFPLLALAWVLTFCWMIFNYFTWKNDQKGFHSRLDKQQEEQKKAILESSQLERMSQLLGRLEGELSHDPERKLSEASINKLAILSRSFVPDGYNYLDEARDYSFVRGQLLLNLLQMEMDSTSFAMIKERCRFGGAELEGADLRGRDLSGIDLECANLRNANLEESNLRTSRLKGAVLWGARLYKADLRGASMHRADLRWANLDEARLSNAVMKGAVLDNARFRKAQMSCVILHYATIRDASFQGANLERTDMFGSDLSRSNFRGTNLNLVDIRMALADEVSFERAFMWESLLRELSVRENDWLSKLDEWKVEGAGDLQSRYEMTNDQSGKSKFQLRIVPK